MLINGVNESTFNARMLTYDIEPATVITYTDWLRQSLDPLNYGKKEQYKAITITFLIKDKDKASCMTDISNLSKAIEQATLKFDDLPYYYDAILNGTPTIRKFLEGKKYYLDVSLQAGYAYLQPVSTILSGTSQTITAQGNLSSPAIVTLTPTQDIDSVEFTGLTKKPITVFNLHSGAPVTIDGEASIVTEPDLDTIMTSAMGAGKWMFRKYSMVSLLDPDVMRIYITPTKEMIPSGSVYMQSLLSDQTDIYHNQGGNDYLGYIKTAVKVSTAKSITLNFCHDDGVNVYFDGTSVYSKDYPESNDAKWAGKANVSISLTASTWHTIEIMWLQHFGDDGIWGFSSTISSQVDQLNAYYARDFRNLFNPATIPVLNAVTVDYNTATGTITVMPTASHTWCQAQYTVTGLSPNSKYYLSARISNSDNTYCAVFNSTGTWLCDCNAALVAPADGTIIIKFFATRDVASIDSVTFSNIQLECGTTASAFTKYSDNSTNSVVNKFPDVDLWSFPVMQPGNNAVSISDSACSVTVAYKPKFM